MNNALFKFQKPCNEPVKGYAPGSEEKAELKKALHRLASEKWEIPLVIGGREVRTGDTGEVVMPHDHRHVLATYHKAGEKEVRMAIEAAMKAHREWARMPWVERASILQRAAELIATKYRYLVNASVMLGQSKNPFQAEIDAPCELVDFLRFNNFFAGDIYADQPCSEKGVINRMEYRPLEGFVFALTPFNFTAIASNLNMSPVLMGKVITASPDLGGFHFTGSTATFNYLWGQIGANLAGYKSYPRIVGETGGKDFIFVHPSSPTTEVAAAIVRGAFEYQGQKCSAASRAYIPKSLWGSIRSEIGDMLREVKMGDVRDFTNLVNAVIDEPSFDNIMANIEYAKHSSDAEVVFGGRGDKSVGYFIEPTVIVTTDPKFKTMVEELFGPVITVFVYDDAKYEETLDLCDASSPYALTGSIFARDRAAITTAMERLRYAAGNFYINDKPTGAVVSQQPFGGSRASGTNDKAGSALNLIRWTNVRAIKETLVPPTDFRYPFLGEK